MKPGSLIILEDILGTDLLSDYRRGLCGQAYFVISSEPGALTVLQPLFINLLDSIPPQFIQGDRFFIYTEAIKVVTMWGEL